MLTAFALTAYALTLQLLLNNSRHNQEIRAESKDSTLFFTLSIHHTQTILIAHTKTPGGTDHREFSYVQIYNYFDAASSSEVYAAESPSESLPPAWANPG